MNIIVYFIINVYKFIYTHTQTHAHTYIKAHMLIYILKYIYILGCPKNQKYFIICFLTIALGFPWIANNNCKI